MQIASRPPTGIIHAASVAAGGVGAGLAQVPGSDAPVLVAIQSAMVLALAEAHHVPMTHAAATQLVLTLSSTMAGRAFTQWAVGWIPGWGNAVNAATAAALTESVGWAAVRLFEEQRPR